MMFQHGSQISSPSQVSKARALLQKASSAEAKEALDLLKATVQAAIQESNTEVEAQALLAQAKILRDLGELEPSLSMFASVLGLFETYQDEPLKADAFNGRASVYHLMGEYALAQKDLKQVFQLAKSLDDKKRMANCLINIGILQTKLADYPQALKSLSRAHKLIREQLTDDLIEIQCLINMALLYEEIEEDHKALETYQEALSKLQGLDNKQLEAICRVNMGNVYKRLGHDQIALEHYEEALRLAESIGFVKVEMAALEGLGQVRSALAEFPKALQLYRLVLKKAQEMGDAESEMDALTQLAGAYLKAQDAEKAFDLLFAALELASESGRKKTTMQVHELLAQAYEQVGQTSLALKHFRDYHYLEKTLFNEENDRKTRQLALQFDLERSQYEADVYKLQTELEREAKEQAEAIVRERTRELEQSYATIEKQRKGLMQAARRSVALNERVLRRLSAELHDGPAQDLGFVLLKLEASDLSDLLTEQPERLERYQKERQKIYQSVERALRDMRAVASGMCLPELGHLSLIDTVKRALRRHELRTESKVRLELSPEMSDASLPVKITVYRLIQESLSNAYKHAAAKGQSIRLEQQEELLYLEISDEGPGFSQEAMLAEQEHLGLVGMRERVESLGGRFSLISVLGQGTQVRAYLPLHTEPALDADYS